MRATPSNEISTLSITPGRSLLFKDQHYFLITTAVSMIRKGRVPWVAKGDAVGQARFISKLFGLAT